VLFGNLLAQLDNQLFNLVERFMNVFLFYAGVCSEGVTLDDVEGGDLLAHRPMLC
jgi:hypothetical protein